MSVREKLLSFTRSVGSGVVFKEYPELARPVGYVMNFVIGFALAAARLFEVGAPFGIAAVAQAGTGIGGAACLAGASAGYLLTGGFDWGIKYVATSVLVYTAAFMFQELKLSARSWFMPAVAAIITAATGFLNNFQTTVPLPILMLTESALAGGGTYFFRIALSPADYVSESAEIAHTVSLLILCACVLMALSGLSIFGVLSIGRFLAVLMVMAASFKGSLTTGAAAGAALGVAMDISSGGAPFFSMAYSFSGLLSGIFQKHGRLMFLLTYTLASLISTLWTWNTAMHTEILYEVFAASVIFLILPQRFLNVAGDVFRVTKTGEGEAGLRRYSADRVRRLGETFGDVYLTVRRSMERETNDNEIATVFDHAAESVCISCRKKEWCWQQNYLDTLGAMNDATASMMERGKLEKADLPEHFTEECLKLDDYIPAVNGELRGLMYRRQYRARLAENRAAAYGQYADMSEIMESIASELDSSTGPDPLGERRLLRYLQSLDIDADVSVFRERGGRLRAVIESARLDKLEPDYLDKLSGVLGVRLCRPGDDVRADGRLILMEAEPLAVSVGIASMRKKGEAVNGDRGTYFKTDGGTLCVILSDGMGTGRQAAQESQAAVRILENFLRSGVSPGTAMKILNSVMLLRDGADWGYATVDLMCIDLFSGETCFYKYGAAPSYVRHGRQIRKVRGGSLAAGLCAGESGAPEMVRIRLKPGSVALIASDGVLGEEDDSWLRSMMGAFEGVATKELAKSALEGAAERFGRNDDMTVLAVCVERR